MNRTKKTAINAFVNLVSILLSSIASFFMVRVVLEKMGSDYNGLNQTVTQLIAILTIFEGSFTSASLIALYEPYGTNKADNVNLICSTAKRAFFISGVVLLVGGVVFAVVFSSFIKTAYTYITIVLIFLISLASTIHSSMFSLKYRILFQVTQTEYILNVISTVGNLLSHAAAYFYLRNNDNIIYLRIIYAIFPITINGVICLVGKKRFSNVSFDMPADFSKIRGTKDLMIGSMTGSIYKSTPFLFISTFAGTIYTSVYAVYSSIYNIVDSISYSLFSAPKNGIGQMIAEKDQGNINRVFKEFELLCLLIISTLLASVGGVIMPFIKIYTKGITDVNYSDYMIAYLILASIFVQYLHMPSGLFINMAGHFKAVKNIQLVSAAALVTFDIIGAISFGIYGILTANLLTGILLAFLEIRYARKMIVHLNNYSLAKHIAVFIGSTILLIYIYNALFSSYVTNYLQFLYIGILIFIISSAVFTIVSYIFFNSDTKALFTRFRNIVIGRKNR